ncbi:MAG: hypothetical protein HQL97_00460 [Magnetococcales bacterium]|nr:hypothetical protein [Magnetococcales bacterium]
MGRKPKPLPSSPIKYDVTRLKGGLDQLTPTLDLPAGFARESSNFECAVTGGYARVGGYERFDGRAKPSDATYGIIQLVAFTNTPTVGQTLTGDTSLATGVIIAIVDEDDEKYLAVTKIVGTFSASEVVKVGATTIGTTTALTSVLTPLLNAQYLNLAADVYRALIQPLPGSGPVRGIVSHLVGGVHQLYVFRDNAGATACHMFRATVSGWSQMTFFNEVYFTAGGASTPADGDVLTQGANTATIMRVVLESGSWAAGTAAGRFIVTTPAPGNLAAGAAVVGAVNVTLSGAQTAIVLLPGGRFEFDINNFSGQLSTRKIYGADGINRCFEWDGVTLVPINTGATVDTPKHIKVHHFHLFVSIGGSIMHSGIGEPYQFTASAGGNEITVGDTITGFLIQPGSADTATMAVLSRNGTGMLYGTSLSTFKYVAFKSSTGAIAYMSQNLDSSYMLDDRGLISLKAAQEFGNFLQASLTQNMHTFIQEKQANALCSCVSKDKSQYRAFFADGSYLYATISNGKFIGALVGLVSHPFNCAWNGESANGSDVSYAGAYGSGYVYELDRGSSFDGDAIEATITLNHNNQKSPRTRKRYRRGSIEVQSSHYAAILFGYTLGYNSTEIAQDVAEEYDTELGGSGNWDGFTWDAFYWDGRTLSPVEVDVKGRAENIQVTFASNTDYIYPFTINSLILHYSFGRGLR